MNRTVYNTCMLVGWLLTSVGAGLAWLPAGFLCAGLMLIALTLVTVRLVATRGSA